MTAEINGGRTVEIPVAEWCREIFKAHQDLQFAQMSATRDKGGREKCLAAAAEFNAIVANALCRAVQFGARGGK